MIQSFHEVSQKLLGLGLDPKGLTFVQISLRGVFVFIVTLIMVRLADKRFFAKKSAFDVIFGFILVGPHRLLGTLAFHSHRFGVLVKGTEDVLVENGEMKPDIMRKTNISERDLLEDLRLNGSVNDPAQVKMARLERGGKISVLPRPAPD